MFCPNCGTQNPETAATCAKCNFNLKGAAAPKFKGTMLMMNNPSGVPAVPRPPTPAGASPPPGAGGAGAAGPGAPGEGGPLAGPPGIGMPSKLKGTMVGVAPPMGIPPSPPRPPSFPPAADVPPPPAFVTNAPSPLGGSPPFAATQASSGQAAPGGTSAFGSFGAPPPVNPLGGTMAADGPNAYGFGTPPPGASPAQPGSGGYGGGGYGQPPPPPPQQEYGGGGLMGQGGYGAPPQQQQSPPEWGPPPQQQQQQQQQPIGGPMMGSGQGMPGQSQQQSQQMMGPGGYGAPGGAMMAPQGQAPMQAGAHGPKGEVRNGTMELVYSFVSCGLYQAFWFYRACKEMNAYLGREDPPFGKILLYSFLTCGLYGMYWQVTQCGAIVQEMQQRAGLQNAQNLGILYLVPYYNVILLQTELNKVWQSPT